MYGFMDTQLIHLIGNEKIETHTYISNNLVKWETNIFYSIYSRVSSFLSYHKIFNAIVTRKMLIISLLDHTTLSEGLNFCFKSF